MTAPSVQPPAAAPPLGEVHDAAHQLACMPALAFEAYGHASTIDELDSVNVAREHLRRSASALRVKANLYPESFPGLRRIGSRRVPDCSVIPAKPSTEQSGQFWWGSRGRIQETTAAS